MNRLLLVVSLCASLAPAARAAPPATAPAASAAAKVHYQAGAQLFSQGRYAQAIDEFKTAAALHPDPALDFDIAQAYDRLGDLANEKSYLERVLNESSSGEPYYERAAKDLGVVDAKIAGRAASQPVAAPAPAPPPAAAPSRGLGAVFWAASAATVTLGAVSVAFAVLGGNADGRLYGGSEPSQRQATSDQSAARTDYLVCDVTAVAAVAAAGVATWLFVRGRSARESDTAVAAALTPGGATLSVAGRF